MNRAVSVVLGVVLIANIWSWMALSINGSYLTGWHWLMLAFKIIIAFYITGPIYREYLK